MFFFLIFSFFSAPQKTTMDMMMEFKAAAAFNAGIKRSILEHPSMPPQAILGPTLGNFPFQFNFRILLGSTPYALSISNPPDTLGMRGQETIWADIALIKDGEIYSHQQSGYPHGTQVLSSANYIVAEIARMLILASSGELDIQSDVGDYDTDEDVYYTDSDDEVEVVESQGRIDRSSKHES